MRISLNDNHHRDARVLVWSQRNIQNFIHNSCLYEFEDIIGTIDAVDIVSPPQYDLMGKVIKKLVTNQTKHFNSLAHLNPYCKSINLEHEYDVFFTVLDFPCNLSSINLLKNWREKCKFAVCYLIEIWHQDIPKIRNFLKFFKDVDLICVGHSQILDLVKEITDSPCIYLAPGIDTVKFHPHSHKSQRCIDVCNLGRRSPVTHQALLKLAEEKHFFYYYDINSGFVVRNNNYQEHRTFIANLLKSSRYFITNYAKVNLPEQTQGQMEIGYRFFEGAAAGNVLLGCPPKTEAFQQYFDWENAVIPMSFNEPQIADIIAELDSQPEYLMKIRTDNVVNSLRKHDWVYRWEEVLHNLGLSSTQALKERKTYLQQLAQSWAQPSTVSVQQNGNIITEGVLSLY